MNYFLGIVRFGADKIAPSLTPRVEEMNMNLKRFTRELEDCRRRWNRQNVRYVLKAASILRRARKAAKSEGRWGIWIRKEIRMNRATVFRYLRVAEFLKTNVALKQHLVATSVTKIYALSRIPTAIARQLVFSGKAERMSDVAFIRMIDRYAPHPLTHPSIPNLIKSLDAALSRLEKSIRFWHDTDLTLPASAQSRLKRRLVKVLKATEMISRGSAVAM